MLGVLGSSRLRPLSISFVVVVLAAVTAVVHHRHFHVRHDFASRHRDPCRRPNRRRPDHQRPWHGCQYLSQETTVIGTTCPLIRVRRWQSAGPRCKERATPSDHRRPHVVACGAKVRSFTVGESSKSAPVPSSQEVTPLHPDTNTFAVDISPRRRPESSKRPSPASQRGEERDVRFLPTCTTTTPRPAAPIEDQITPQHQVALAAPRRK